MSNESRTTFEKISRGWVIVTAIVGAVSGIASIGIATGTILSQVQSNTEKVETVLDNQREVLDRQIETKFRVKQLTSAVERLTDRIGIADSPPIAPARAVTVGSK